MDLTLRADRWIGQEKRESLSPSRRDPRKDDLGVFLTNLIIRNFYQSSYLSIAVDYNLFHQNVNRKLAESGRLLNIPIIPNLGVTYKDHLNEPRVWKHL